MKNWIQSHKTDIGSNQHQQFEMTVRVLLETGMRPVVRVPLELGGGEGRITATLTPTQCVHCPDGVLHTGFKIAGNLAILCCPTHGFLWVGVCSKNS